MKRKNYIFILSVLMFAGCAKMPTPTLDIIIYRYILTTPKDYSASKSYPLIIFLHGGGACVDSVNSYYAFGLGKYAEEHDDFPFIVFAPQACDKEFDLDVVWKMAMDLTHTYSVDLNRIYVTGFSQGGYSTYELAYEHPDSIAAIAPVAAWWKPHLASSIKDVPVWIFHDKGDPVVPYTDALDMYNALVNAGCDVNFTVYENNSHSGWYEAYQTDELYIWFLQHSISNRGEK